VNIGGWLQSLGMGRYEQAFRDNDIGLDVLPALTAGFQRLRTAIPIDCGQSFQLIADSVAPIADRELPSTVSWVHAQTSVSSLRQPAEIFGLNALGEEARPRSQ
jgi:SAM (Sterile alpha motif) domain-containing protein